MLHQQHKRMARQQDRSMNGDIPYSGIDRMPIAIYIAFVAHHFYASTESNTNDMCKIPQSAK
jgi:hypothetical protein